MSRAGLHAHAGGELAALAGASSRRRRAKIWLAGWLAAGLVLAPLEIAAAQEAPHITVTSPTDKQTIHDNSGALAVETAVENTRTGAQGTAIRVLLDGKPYGPLQHATAFTLHAIDRGEHTLQAELLDSSGSVIATSAPVVFYMWQASVLFPSRRK